MDDGIVAQLIQRAEDLEESQTNLQKELAISHEKVRELLDKVDELMKSETKNKALIKNLENENKNLKSLVESKATPLVRVKSYEPAS